MTNQEQYELLCEKAEKYDKMVNVLQEIRREIGEYMPITTDISGSNVDYMQGLHRARIIIDKYISEYTGEQA